MKHRPSKDSNTDCSPTRALLQLLGPMRWPLAFSTSMRIAHQLLSMAFLVVAIGGAMRMIEAGPIDSSPWALIGWLAVIGVIKGVCRYLEQFSGHYVAFHLLASLRMQLFEKLERLAPAGLGEDRSGDLLSRSMADIERIEVFYAHTVAPIITAIVVPWIAVAAVAAFSPALAGILIVCLAVTGLVTPWILRRGAREAAHDCRHAAAELTARLTDGLLGLGELLSMGAGDRWVRAIDADGRRLERTQFRLSAWGAAQSGATAGLVGIATVTTLAAGGLLGASGALSAYDFPVVVALVMSAFYPLLGLGSLIADLQQALQSGARVFEILDRPEPELSARPRSTGVSRPTGCAVEFDRVGFCYPGGQPVLDGIRLSIESGRIYAITGPSGAGKSTLFHLMARFWQPTEGRIWIRGTDIRELDEDDLRRTLCIVPQRPHIFQTTIRENLLLGNPDASPAEITHALRLAQLENWIHGLDQGLDTQTGTLGARLSGGQRQRLALARAFLRDAPVLLLDEATSALDAAHETTVQQAIRHWVDERPTGPDARAAVLISHRISTLRSVDQVVVLEAGRVVELGSPTALHESRGVFSELLGV